MKIVFKDKGKPIEMDAEAPLGWVFGNESDDLCWSARHPIRNGSHPEAQDVKPATVSDLRTLGIVP